MNACLSPKLRPADKLLIQWLCSGEDPGSMITLLLHMLRLLPFLCGGHCHLALENLALRQQLAAYKRMVTRPKLRMTDRLFWVALASVWAGWRAGETIEGHDEGRGMDDVQAERGCRRREDHLLEGEPGGAGPGTEWGEGGGAAE